MKEYLAGTYTNTGSQGLYRFALENGHLTHPDLIWRVEMPKYVASSKAGIVVLTSRGTRSGVILLNVLGKVKDKILFENRSACYVGMDHEHVYTANYHTGVCADLKIISGMLHLRHKIELGEEAGCHQVLVHGDELYIPCLCQDRIAVFDKNTYVECGTIVFPEGTGPRHGVFTKDGRMLYIVGEISCKLYTIDAQSHDIIQVNAISFAGAPSAVRLSDDETMLYTAVRGTGEITVFRLQDRLPRKAKVIPTPGKCPQDLILCEGGILCADKEQGKVYWLDEDGKVLDEVLVPGASSICEI